MEGSIVCVYAVNSLFKTGRGQAVRPARGAKVSYLSVTGFSAHVRQSVTPRVPSKLYTLDFVLKIKLSSDSELWHSKEGSLDLEPPLPREPQS